MDVEHIALWSGFTALVVVLLLIDLLLVSRNADVMSVRKALLWSAMWIGVAVLFGIGVIIVLGGQKGGEYFTGYLIEKSLSIDNLFVFLVIFGYFAVPRSLQPRALTWGIMGALIMRLIFILTGSALLNTFHWIVFIFGGVLILTAIRLAREQEDNVDPERNIMVRLVRAFMPVTPEFHGNRFFVKIDGKKMATPFLLTLGVIATTDLVFAVDSIPAIFAITTDAFIVYTSNAFAILGMRALFFAIAGVLQYFIFLRQALVTILMFVGIKMIVSEWYHVPIPVSLGFVGATLGIAVILSLIVGRRREKAGHGTHNRSDDLAVVGITGGATQDADDGEHADGDHDAEPLGSTEATAPESAPLTPSPPAL